MKFTTKKRGFTIIELVIVIAVVAILAAVLIPVFSNLVQQGKDADAKVVVRNLNTGLNMETTKPATMHDALAIVEKNVGINVAKLNDTYTKTGNQIVWDSKEGEFLFVKSSGEKIAADGSESATEEIKLWAIANKEADLEGSYSYYWNGGNKDSLTVATGFDAGEYTIANLSYDRSTATEGQSVVIRTNGGVLVVNAELDTVKHYGDVNSVDITKVAPNSYHEYGTVKGDVVIAKGHLILESTSSVGTVKVADNAAANEVKLSNNSNEAIICVDAENKLSSDSNLGETSIKVQDKDAVALIGNQSYKTIDAALIASKDGDTVKLIADYNIPENVADTRIARIVIDKKITLDFGCYHLIAVQRMGDFDNNFAAIFVGADATFIADGEGGIICNDGPYAINVINGATLTVKSGRYNGGGTSIQVQKGKLEIIGGVFEATPYSNPTYGYKFMINCVDAAFKDGTAKISIKGGSFYKFDPANSKSENPHGDFVAEGYKVNCIDDWYTVIPE